MQRMCCAVGIAHQLRNMLDGLQDLMSCLLLPVLGLRTDKYMSVLDIGIAHWAKQTVHC